MRGATLRDPRRLLLLLLCLGAAPALSQSADTAEHGAWLVERDRALAAIGLEAGFVPDVPANEPPVAAASVADGQEPQVVESDLRLALTQVALASGSVGQARIAEAQSKDAPGAIFLRAGEASLAKLYELTRGTDLESVLRREGDAVVASRPIVVVQGASLWLGPGDVLELEDGAFLVSFGHLSMSGATIRADAPPLGQEDAFRPFVASLATGTLDVSWSVFVGLGSNVAPVASGLALSSGSLFAGDGTSVIRDNRFIDVHGLSVLDGDGAAVLDNRFDRPRGVAIWADGSDGVEIRGNLVVEAEGFFAARIDGPATGVTFADNVLVGGQHAGLRVASGAAAVDLRGNVLEGFAGRGLVAEGGASCLRIGGNLIRGNGGDGVSAQAIGDAIVTGNAVLGNGGAGVSLEHPLPEAELVVAGNQVADNRSGVRASAVGSLLLAENDLSNQLPRHLAGDLSQHTPLFLRESRGGVRPSLAFHAVQAEPAAPFTPEDAQAAFDACRTEARS